MAKVDAKEGRSLAKMLAEMNSDSAAAQANMERMFATQDKGIRRLEGQMKKLATANTKSIRKKIQELDKLNDRVLALTTSEKNQKKVLTEEIKELDKANSAIYKLSQTTQEAGTSTNQLTQLFSRQISTVRQYLSITGVLAGVIQGVVSLYENWARLQTVVTEGMGRATQALGGTAEQMSRFQTEASGLRNTFGHLEGDVDGLALSMQHQSEVMLALRRNAESLGEGVNTAMLRSARGFGIGNESAGQLLRLLETGVNDANSSMDDFGADMINFASAIGGNASQLVTDFVDARASIAQFGDEGVETFRNAAMMANEFGFETRRIFDMMRGFDTFSQASQNVNQLNAVLGTSLSSYELMIEQDPSARLEMIRQQINMTGQSWGNMSRQQHQLLSSVTGESEDILARVFGDGRSLAEVRAETERREAAETRRAQRQQSNQDMMQDLLERTSVVWDNMGRIIQRVVNMLSESLGPIFGVIHKEVNGLAYEFSQWLNSMVKSGQAEQFIRNVSNSIRDIFQWLRSVNWTEVWESTTRTWREWSPIVQSIGTVLMDLLQFAADHPGIIGGLFAGAAIARFSGMLSAIPGAMALLGGAAIPGAALAGAGAVALNSQAQHIETGTRSATDMAYQNRLGSTGLEELRRRRGMDQQERVGGTQHTGVDAWLHTMAGGIADVGSALGYRSSASARRSGFGDAQERDQQANTLSAVINDIIRGSHGARNQTVADRIYRAAGEENRGDVDRAVGGNLLQYIEQQRGGGVPGTYGVAQYPNMMQFDSAASAPAAATTAATTVASANPDQLRDMFTVNVNLDGRQVGRGLVERANSGRSSTGIS